MGRGTVATRALTAGALAAALVILPWGSSSAFAATGGVGPVAMSCSAQGVVAPTQAQVASITATAARDSVAEDDLLPVTLATALPTLPAGLAITGAHLTLPIPVDVSNVDLSFSGGTIQALSWDARSGTEIIIHLKSGTPMAPAAVQVPDITVSYAFDLGSAGRTVHWPAFAVMAVDVEAEGGAAGTVTCRPTTTPPTLLDTSLTAPVGLERRGPITLAEPLPPGGGAPAPGGGATGPGGTTASPPAGTSAPGATTPATGRGAPGSALGPGGTAAGGGSGADGTRDGGGSAGPSATEALTQPVNLFIMAAVALTGFSAAVLFTRRRPI